MRAKKFARQAAVSAGKTRLGRDAIHHAVVPPQSGRTFDSVTAWPASLEGFDRLSFLFTSSVLDHGIASLAFDEGAHLYRTVADLQPGTIVEIGRFKGGSTLIIAAAMAARSELYSYDLHAGLPDGLDGQELDRNLRHVLRRYGVEDRVHLIVGDSKSAALPGACNLVFVDGDHSYAGARADYERWSPLLRPGGHLLFHDAADSAGFRSFDRAVAELVSEIEQRDSHIFERRLAAGSIAHFVRRSEPQAPEG